MNGEMILEVVDIHTYYGGSYILKGLSIRLSKGEICCILGRNGMGKTTTLKSIMGLTSCREGDIYFNGDRINSLKPWERAGLGIGYVPQDRGIFPSLTVYENMVVSTKKLNPEDLVEVYNLFPRLEERKDQLASGLSGGERQMLACAKALVKNPRLILMDEPSEGLAPAIVNHLMETILSIHRKGVAVLLVEQNVPMSLKIADRAYLIESGEIKYDGNTEELAQKDELIKKYVGV